MLIYGTNGWIHLSIGRADRFFRWAVIEFAVTALLFVLGLHWGAAGVAMAWTASFWILVVPSFWYAGKPIEFPIRSMMAAVWKYGAASLIAGIACALTVRQMPLLTALSGAQGATARCLVISLLFTTLYLGAIVLLHGSWTPLAEFVGLLREMLPWEKLVRKAPASSGLRAMPAPTIEP
jgi:PST family polysaccharide transporter